MSKVHDRGALDDREYPRPTAVDLDAGLFFRALHGGNPEI